MKKASIRELQHHLGKVLRYLEHGDEILITRRNTVVARLLPPDDAHDEPEWPDFSNRANELFPDTKDTALSEEILRDRDERV
jgi:prevent-host-death family protein